MMKIHSTGSVGFAGWLLAVAALGLGTPAAAQDAEKVLNIHNWSDHIADDTITSFEKETGIKVRYDNLDTDEIVHAKLVAGKTDCDIVVPGEADMKNMTMPDAINSDVRRTMTRLYASLETGL